MTSVGMISNKKFHQVVTEVFIRGKKLNISLVLITQSYFQVILDTSLNTAHFFIIKNPKKQKV